MLSRDDIKHNILEQRIQIYPFEKKNLTGIGYNLSTTNFAFSINQGILLTIHSRITTEGERHYVIIPKQDTVLFFSKEYIGVDNSIAGTFHSKVSRVCQGLGHISTTLDPTWKGQLIISVNNPTSKDIRFELDDSSGNIFTLLMYRFNTSVGGEKIHDNNSGRCDLLLKHFVEPKDTKVKEKHLELKAYIVDEFANSLNGYDNFLSQPINDEYTEKISDLQKLHQRLNKERVILREDRYVLGKSGEYYILQNQKEHDLIEQCTLYELRRDVDAALQTGNKITMEMLEKEFFRSDELRLALNVLDEYLKIIEYELEMLNHCRRIEWQNRKVLEYAGEESELVKLRERDKKTKWVKMNVFRCGVGLFLIAGFIYANKYMELPKSIITFFSAIIGGIIVLLVENIGKTMPFRKDKKLLD